MSKQLHHPVPVDVGPDGVERLALAQLGDALFQRVHPRGQQARLALVARRAVAAGQLVELVEQGARVAGVAAHGGVAPHVVAVAVEAEVQEHQPPDVVDTRSGSAARAGGRRPCGPRRPRGGGSSRPWGRSTGSSACRRRAAAPPAARTRRGEVLATTAIVWASTSLCRWIGSCSRRIARSSGRNSSDRPVSARNHRPALGSSTTSSFDSSSRIRSADTISSRPAHRLHRRDQGLVGREAVARR